MKINLAHLRERSTSGGWINFAVFDAESTSGTNAGNAAVLSNLTMRARRAGLKIDKSALAFVENGRPTYYGTPDLVQYLSRRGVPRWTHSIDV